MKPIVNEAEAIRPSEIARTMGNIVSRSLPVIKAITIPMPKNNDFGNNTSGDIIAIEGSKEYVLLMNGMQLKVNKNSAKKPPTIPQDTPRKNNKSENNSNQAVAICIFKL